MEFAASPEIRRLELLLLAGEERRWRKQLLVAFAARGCWLLACVSLGAAAGGHPRFAAPEKGEERSSRSCCLPRLAAVLVAAMAARREESREGGGTRDGEERLLRATSPVALAGEEG